MIVLPWYRKNIRIADGAEKNISKVIHERTVEVFASQRLHVYPLVRTYPRGTHEDYVSIGIYKASQVSLFKVR